MVTPLDGDQVWWPHVQEVNRRIEEEFGVKGFTYQGHGRSGAASAVDYLVSSEWGQRANKQQEEFGVALQKWFERNWEAANVDYLIWWESMNDGKGWFKYNWRAWPGGNPNPVTKAHYDHFHVTFLPPPRTVGRLVSGDDMAWEKVILAHAGYEDGQLCADAYKVLMGAKIQASIANADNIERAINYFQSFDVTNGEAHFIVVGQAAQQKFPADIRPFIGAPEDESDYRDAVGTDTADTRRKLAIVLDGISEGLGERLPPETT